MKDKKWLKQKVEFGKVHMGGQYDDPDKAYVVNLQHVKQAIDRLDEPELPEIPQYVADWLEENKFAFNLRGAFSTFTHKDDDRYSKKVNDWLYYLDEKGNGVYNDETFAIAWIYGYTVKKDKYVVETSAGTYFIIDIDGREWDYTGIPMDEDSIKHATKFTSKEQAEAVVCLFGGIVKKMEE